MPNLPLGCCYKWLYVSSVLTVSYRNQISEIIRSRYALGLYRVGYNAIQYMIKFDDIPAGRKDVWIFNTIQLRRSNGFMRPIRQPRYVADNVYFHSLPSKTVYVSRFNFIPPAWGQLCVQYHIYSIPQGESLTAPGAKLLCITAMWNRSEVT